MLASGMRKVQDGEEEKEYCRSVEKNKIAKSMCSKKFSEDVKMNI